MNRAFSVFALFALACNGDTGKGTGDTGTGPGDTTNEPVVDSCTWGLGLCYEFTDYNGTSAWCDEIEGGYYTSFTTTTDYSGGGCAGGDIFKCLVPAVTSADGQGALVYYYTDFGGDPATACSNAGGTPQVIAR